MIGLLGGTFDPIHLGHLRMALVAYETYKLKEVWFIPTYLPVHKKAPLASAKHRLAMLKLAIASQENFRIKPCELDRKTPSYMIETLTMLHEENPQEQFGLILGSTELLDFTHWHRFEEILKMTKLITVPRGTVDAFPISSTAIRKIIKAGKNPRYLLPDNVLVYITAHRLYQRSYE